MVWRSPGHSVGDATCAGLPQPAWQWMQIPPLKVWGKDGVSVSLMGGPDSRVATSFSPTLTVRGPLTPHFWGEGRGIRGVRSAEASENLLTHFSPDRLLEVKLRAIP